MTTNWLVPSWSCLKNRSQIRNIVDIFSFADTNLEKEGRIFYECLKYPNNFNKEKSYPKTRSCYFEIHLLLVRHFPFCLLQCFMGINFIRFHSFWSCNSRRLRWKIINYLPPLLIYTSGKMKKKKKKNTWIWLGSTWTRVSHISRDSTGRCQVTFYDRFLFYSAILPREMVLEVLWNPVK